MNIRIVASWEIVVISVLAFSWIYLRQQRLNLNALIDSTQKNGNLHSYYLLKLEKE